MKKLSKVQTRAHEKLISAGMDKVGGQSPYDLQESIATLDALVRMGLARCTRGAGAIFDPRTGLKYSLR